MSYFFPGGIGCAWCLAGVFLIYDNPSVHPRISAEERQYIETALGGVQKVGSNFSDEPL